MKPTRVSAGATSDLVSGQVKSHRAANFDAMARPYRWLEYFTFGRLLESVRFAQIPCIADRRHALVLGDGDGRFLARLAVNNRTLNAEAVDSSPRMLALLQSRMCEVGAGDRVTLTQADVLDQTFAPCGKGYDLVATHFFFDCFTGHEVETIVDRVIAKLAHESVWIVSEFDVPPAGPRMCARILIRLLYMSFGLLTGLSVRSLPDYRRVLQSRGFYLERRTTALRGILVSELWRRKKSQAKKSQSSD
jgi:SAM-dependent methyltransferase